MKKLLLTFLAVFLVVSMGFTMFPTQSAEAKHTHKQGIIFHIKADGQGTYEKYPPWPPNQETGSGEFSINLNGSGNFYSMGRGLAFHGGGGYLKGSFNNHEMNINLQVARVESLYSHIKYPNLPIRIHLHAKGLYNGEVMEGWGQLYGTTYIQNKGYWIKPDATEMKVKISLMDKNNIQHVLYVDMDDTADILKVDIDLVGY